jgi:hypothetical protein
VNPGQTYGRRISASLNKILGVRRKIYALTVGSVTLCSARRATTLPPAASNSGSVTLMVLVAKFVANSPMPRSSNWIDHHPLHAVGDATRLSDFTQ